MQFHKTVNKIKELLEQNHFWYEYFEHEPVRTSEEAAKVRNGEYSIAQGAKALIVKYKTSGEKEYKFAMLVIPGDKKFDKKKALAVLEAKDISFASEEQVSEITDGVQVGGVPPFGNLFGLRVFVDKSVLENEKIIFNAGDKRISIAIKTQDYLILVKPIISDII